MTPVLLRVIVSQGVHIPCLFLYQEIACSLPDKLSLYCLTHRKGQGGCYRQAHKSLPDTSSNLTVSPSDDDLHPPFLLCLLLGNRNIFDDLGAPRL